MATAVLHLLAVIGAVFALNLLPAFGLPNAQFAAVGNPGWEAM